MNRVHTWACGDHSREDVWLGSRRTLFRSGSGHGLGRGKSSARMGEGSVVVGASVCTIRHGQLGRDGLDGTVHM